jgi:hypothetical protein
MKGDMDTYSSKFEIHKLTIDHVEDMYQIYLASHSYHDDHLSGEDSSRLIVNDENTYTYDEFLDLCKNTKTFILGAMEVIPYQDYNTYTGLVDNTPVMLNVLRGYIIFEKLKESGKAIYSILFLEGDLEYKEKVYETILTFMRTKLLADNIIRIEVEDDGIYTNIKLLRQNGFKQKSLVPSRRLDRNDIFILELSKS